MTGFQFFSSVYALLSIIRQKFQLGQAAEHEYQTNNPTRVCFQLCCNLFGCVWLTTEVTTAPLIPKHTSPRETHLCARAAAKTCDSFMKHIDHCGMVEVQHLERPRRLQLQKHDCTVPHVYHNTPDGSQSWRSFPQSVVVVKFNRISLGCRFPDSFYRHA